MPRLIVKRKKPNPTPRCGRRIVYVNPHSPFQKLVESSRLKRDISIRELADEINGITGRPFLNSGSLWIWLRNVNGFPHPKSATRKRLVALARVLRVPMPRLEEALDSSRHLFTAREQRQPAAALNALEQFVAIIQADKRTYLPRSRVLNIAQSLLESAKAPRRSTK